MLLDRHLQIVGAAVMQEEDTLADTPERRTAELSASGIALCDVIGEPGAHAVHGKIAERRERHIALS
jgi:hypothetical protein